MNIDFLDSIKEESSVLSVEDEYITKVIEKGKPLQASLEDMAQILGDAVEIRPFEDVEKLFAPEAPGAVFCFTENEGKQRKFALVRGRTVYEAEVCAEVLKKAAEIEIKAECLGGTKPLSALNCKIMREKYLNSYSKKEGLYEEMQRTSCKGKANKEENLYGAGALTWALADAREKLVEYGLKLQAWDLVQGTWGNLSVRISEEIMLCTPSGISYDKLKPEDMTAVNIFTDKMLPNCGTSVGVKETSESIMHTEIYRKRNDVGSIIHTHSKYASVFAAAEKGFADGNIGISEYASAGTHELAIKVAEALGDSSAVIMAHHGMVAVGENLVDAFDMAGALEREAENQIKFGRK